MMSCSGRRLVLAALVGLAAWTLAPARASTPAIPALARSTTIVGRTSAVMKVWIPSNVTLSSNRVSVSGSGRFGGVLLRRVRSTFHAPFSLFVNRFNMCFSAPGCAPKNPKDYFFFQGIEPEYSEEQARLPRGYYQLYLFTDGSPVTVRLTISGLTGSTNLTPTRRFPYTVESPTPFIPTPDPATPYYSVGLTHHWGGAAAGLLMALGFDVPIPGHVETLYGVCDFKGKPLPGYVMVPGCPSMSGPHGGATLDDGTITADRYRGGVFGGGLSEPGTWTTGAYFVNGGPTTRAGNVYVLFDVDDRNTP